MMKIFFKNRVASFVLAFLMAGLIFVSHHNAYAQRVYTPIQTSPVDLELVDVSTVQEILKSDLMKLENGKIYRLDNIRVPVRLGHVLQAHLKKTLVGTKVGIYIADKDPTNRTDRLGHISSHIMTEDGKWVQADIVSRGLAWATSTTGSRDLVRTLYKYEDVARAQSLGLWDIPEYQVKNDTTIVNTYNSFQIYEGTLKSVEYKDKFTYMNFGDDPATDFTLVLDETGLPLQKIGQRGTGQVPSQLVGNKIRVRGWVEELSGPMMNLTHSEQLEFPDLPSSPVP